MLQTKTHIWIADDDQDDLEFLQWAIRETEPEAVISIFRNGADFLAHFFNPSLEKPDVIFLDLNMPKMDGETVLQVIKKQADSNIPIIILSTSFDLQKKDSLIKSGASDYHCKPSDIRQYTTIVQSVFQQFVSRYTSAARVELK